MLDTVEIKKIMRIFERQADSREKMGCKLRLSHDANLRTLCERMIGEAAGFREARDILDELCRSAEG